MNWLDIITARDAARYAVYEHVTRHAGMASRRAVQYLVYAAGADGALDGELLPHEQAVFEGVAMNAYAAAFREVRAFEEAQRSQN